MRKLRCACLLLAFATACSRGPDATPQPPPEKKTLPGPIGLGERVRSDARQQNDAAQERKKLFEEALESK